MDYAKTVANISVRLCDPHSFVPPVSSGSAEGDAAAAAAAAAAARNDAEGDDPDAAAREEAGEARRTIGTMLEDLRASEAEARARGEEGVGGGGLGSAEGRGAAADEVLRQALERERQGTAGNTAGTAGAAVDNGGVGRVLGGAGGSRRNGPTVDEILRPGRVGAQRSGPPPSEAARKAAAGAVGVTLPWLLRKGILSRCKPSQALAMRTLQRLVKVCDKEALMPHLAELVATLIEGLSALEPQVRQSKADLCWLYLTRAVTLQKESPPNGTKCGCFCRCMFCLLLRVLSLSPYLTRCLFSLSVKLLIAFLPPCPTFYCPPVSICAICALFASVPRDP